MQLRNRFFYFDCKISIFRNPFFLLFLKLCVFKIFCLFCTFLCILHKMQDAKAPLFRLFLLKLLWKEWLLCVTLKCLLCASVHNRTMNYHHIKISRHIRKYNILEEKDLCLVHIHTVDYSAHTKGLKHINDVM